MDINTYNAELDHIRKITQFDELTARMIKCVCDVYNTSLSVIHSESRAKKVAGMRRLICHLLRWNNPKLTLKEIARAIGRTDHSTVCYHLSVPLDEKQQMQYNWIVRAAKRDSGGRE